MVELVKTILLLSGLGFVVTAILLCLKPITAKRFPARWQYSAWVVVLILMLIPVYKLIPASGAKRVSQMVSAHPSPVQTPDILPAETPTLTAPITKAYGVLPLRQNTPIGEVIAVVWVIGFAGFLSFVIVNYLLFVRRKRKDAITLSDAVALNEVKEALHIKRIVRIKMSAAVQSPLLVGIIRPTVYLPCRELSDEQLWMIFLHELTHYKRKDLLVKWLSVFVNAVHWFNPLAYLLTANVSESCEVSCDMAVTRNMSEKEQKAYMKTILDLLEQKEAS